MSTLKKSKQTKRHAKECDFRVFSWGGGGSLVFEGSLKRIGSAFWGPKGLAFICTGQRRPQCTGNSLDETLPEDDLENPSATCATAEISVEDLQSYHVLEGL